MMRFGAPPRRRRPNLTPMIDVVFLLLVFFMLAARFGVDRVLPLSPGGGAEEAWRGPPRLVGIGPERIFLNGAEVAPDALAQALRPLMTRPGDPIVLRARDGADVQRVVDVAALLNAAGFGALALAE